MQSRFMVSAVLAATVLVGCKKDETTVTNPQGGASTKPTTKPSSKSTMPAAMDAAATDAQKKLAEITQYLQDKKYDAADKGLKELEDHKSTLPQSVQDQLPTFRQMVDGAKMSTATTMPKLTVPATMPKLTVPTTAPSTSDLPTIPKE